MARYRNEVALEGVIVDGVSLGYRGQDPVPFVSFQIAGGGARTGADGERGLCRFTVEASGKTAREAAKEGMAGRPVLVTGKLCERFVSEDSTGEPRSVIVVTAESLEYGAPYAPPTFCGVEMNEEEAAALFMDEGEEDENGFAGGESLADLALLS